MRSPHRPAHLPILTWRPTLVLALCFLMTACGVPGLDFALESGTSTDSGSSTTDSDSSADADSDSTSNSSTTVAVEFADDGSIVGAEALMASDGAIEYELTFNDEEEEAALEEGRMQLSRLQKERMRTSALKDRHFDRRTPASQRNNPRFLTRNPAQFKSIRTAPNAKRTAANSKRPLSESSTRPHSMKERMQKSPRHAPTPPPFPFPNARD